ncbi:MAG: hydrogenase 4 subunit F [Candidatus Omnitrophica bacterium]|nr:hydrogenase 4 subunit F [Candidatus Omnitrophota bacterium]
MQIFIVLAIPILLAIYALVDNSAKRIGITNALGYALMLFFSVTLFADRHIGTSHISFFDFIYLDALSVFFIFVISIIAFAAALYSISYICSDLQSALITQKKAKLYYLFFNLFCFSMFLVPSVNNLGMMWVAIEMTTLISAFLVGFYNTKLSVEAAWKYIVICSLGIIFALLGTILFSYAYSVLGESKSLNWTELYFAATRLDKNIIKVAFIFIMVGYGTKAGLAPMHTWLPDAHSQAVSPASALLSGVLLKTALYGILRFSIILNKSVGPEFVSHLFILFGMMSIAVAAGFVLVQKDLKRLLAYSSIEHIGIISVGLGLGGVFGLFGALMHIFNHAAAKAMMFFGAGNIVKAYKEHNMNSIRGVAKIMPFTGVMTLIGLFALSGFPPLAIFLSEISIAIAAFSHASYILGIVFLALLAIVFSAMIRDFSKMIFGNVPSGMKKVHEPFGVKSAMLLLFLQIALFSFFLPWIFKDNFWAAIKLLQGA